MVGPQRKKEAVMHLRDTFGVGERRACRVMRQPRSTQRYKPLQPDKDKALSKAMRETALSEPRAGYRTVTRLLQRDGWLVNVKRVHRLWKAEGLKVPAKSKHKRRRSGSGNSTQKRAAEHLNHVWSYDFVSDQTEDGKRLKWLPIVDEYSREVLGLRVERSITSELVIEELERLVSERGVPAYIRSDNGPEFVATAVKNWIREKGFETAYVDPGSPWQNAYVESFNSRFRDEFLNMELFGSLLEAKVLGEEHRHKYNTKRPHSSLDGLTPAEYASGCASPLRPPAFAAMRSQS